MERRRRDAIKLASSINEKGEQSIRREKQLRVTNQMREIQTPANFISFVSQSIPKQTRCDNSPNSYQTKVNMANNKANTQIPSAIYHGVNTKTVIDGDTDSVVETSRADLLQEIRITESELRHLKKKSHLVYMGGQWRHCKRKRDWNEQIVQKHLGLEELYDSLEQLREPNLWRTCQKDTVMQ